MAAELKQALGLLEKLTETADKNTAAFRDVMCIMDAKTYVLEAIVRDVVKGTVHKDVNGVDAAHYFEAWKRQLVEDEAAKVSPYGDAVVFGGDFHA